MATSMLMGMGTTAYAQDASKIYKSDVMAALHLETVKSLTVDYIDSITIKSLIDFDGNEFELVETGAEGYYIFDRGGTSSSWGKTIRDAMIDYCNAYGVSATSTYYVTNWDIFAEVGRGRR